jgi:hypothetical protein
MGFFSYKCEICSHPALCRQACDREINGWMSRVVAITREGELHAGEYDGYGRVGVAEVMDSRFSLYHRACWEMAGKPTVYTNEARHAPDQGWFFNDGDHDMLDPRETVGLSPEEISARLAPLVAARDGQNLGFRWLKADEDADPGTYNELYRLTVVVPAESMTVAERHAKYGYDPVADYQQYGY